MGWQQPRSPALTKLALPTLKWSRRPPLRIRIPARARACLQHARTSWLRLLATSSQISAVTARAAAPPRRLDQLPLPSYTLSFFGEGGGFPPLAASPCLSQNPARTASCFLALCVYTRNRSDIVPPDTELVVLARSADEFQVPRVPCRSPDFLTRITQRAGPRVDARREQPSPDARSLYVELRFDLCVK